MAACRLAFSCLFPQRPPETGWQGDFPKPAGAMDALRHQFTYLSLPFLLLDPCTGWETEFPHSPMEASDPQTEPPLQGVEEEAAGAAGPDPHTAAWDRLIACNTKVTHTINTRPPHRCLGQAHCLQHCTINT